MPMMTMLDKVIMRAANDENFRKALMTDPDAALATMDEALSDYEYAALEEYRRVACRMIDEQEQDEHRGYMASEHDSSASLM